MSAKIIDCRKIADKIYFNLEKRLKYFKKKKLRLPKIVCLKVIGNEATDIYSKSLIKLFQKLGINHQIVEFNKKVDEKALIEKIVSLNNNGDIDGIFVGLPLPEKFDKNKIQNLIDPLKDVEGVTATNLGKLIYRDATIIVAPCTALAAIECVKATKINLKGKHVVVIGHSEIVGKPIALLLLSSAFNSPTVTVCHIGTKNLDYFTKQADVLIVAVGKPCLINGDMVKKGAIVIDVGINKIKNKKNHYGEKSNIVGDCDFSSTAKYASYISSVPGGVGIVTPMILVNNLLNLYCLRNNLPIEKYKVL